MMLKDKVILVTGSSTGIGRAIAERCLAEGARVMIHGLDTAEAKASAEALSQPYFATNLSEPENAEQLMTETIAYYGRLDGLVNNAAVVTRSNLETTNADMFDQIMAVNLRAPLLLIRAAVPQFHLQGGGVVLNIGSVNAYCGQPNLLAYSISKGGLMTLTRNLADAHSREKIRVNQLNLGWTLSENEIKLQISEGRSADWYKNVPPVYAPSGSLFLPAQVANHAIHWLSDASAPVSGSILEIEQYPIIGRNAAKDLA